MRVTGTLQSICKAVGSLVLFGVALACAGPAAASPPGTMYTVLNPTGNPPPVKLRAMAERPASLKGGTIYMVSNTFDNADKFLQSMQVWMGVHQPDVKTVYRVKKGDYVLDDPALWNEIKANNGMMVMAIGH